MSRCFSRFLSFTLLIPLCVPAHAATKAFAYAGSNYIITAEVSGPHAFVVNFINLSEYVIVIQPSDLIYKGTSGRMYIGQVYEQEHKNTRGETFRYSGSILLKGKSFTGLTVLGAFHEQDQIEELSVRIGSKRFYLEAMEKVRFDQLAAKIGELDLQAPNTGAALEQANIGAAGVLKATDGSSEWDRDWQGILNPDGTNPPRIVEHPEITPTDEARKKNIAGRIRLTATITRNGGLQDLKIVKGLGHGLDERALEAIKNSWIFLPATKNGEVLEATIFFEANFPAPDSKKP